MKIFFADPILNLNILQYEDRISNTNGSDDPVLTAIEKYKNQPSIKLTKTISENVSFCFQEIQAIEIEKELQNLGCSKASQDSDIPTKIIKDNIDIFAPVLLTEFNESLKLSRFPDSTFPLAYFRICQKYLKDAFINNYQHILMGYFLNNNVDLQMFQCTTQFIKTTRKMERKFRPSLGSWCFIN